MADALASSLIAAVLGLQLGSTAQDAGNRFSLEGLTVRPGQEGALEIGLQKLEGASLRLASGPFVLEVGRFALHKLVAQLRIEGGRAHLAAAAAANAELSAVKIHGPLVLPPGAMAGASSPDAWSLGPLATADGTIQAEIVDAHLLFDADVTVPIRQGRIDFKDATVEHVGPDSRMGVSRLGLYVDAPNGRSYLYQFSSAPIAGVEYERRSALPGPWASNRGNLQLQPFTESLLRQARGGRGHGLTEQARLLFERTAVSGHVQLSDGTFAAPGVQADVVGRAAGRNVVRLHSEAVGRGLTIDIASWAVRNAVLNAKDMQLGAEDITGALVLRLDVEGTQLRFAFDVAEMKVSGLRLGPHKAA